VDRGIARTTSTEGKGAWWLRPVLLSGFPILRVCALWSLMLWTTVACESAAPAGSPDSSSGVNAPEHLDAPYVVLISFDGFAWDLMDRHPAPSFERVAREGVRAERMIPTFPTKPSPPAADRR